jgi:exodeoxyribonuclease III
MKRADSEGDSAVEQQGEAKKQRQKQPSAVLARDETPRRDAADKEFKIVSWNVNGLRAIMKSKSEIFSGLVKQEMPGEQFSGILIYKITNFCLSLLHLNPPDLLCLQETKLQEKDVGNLENIVPGYTSHWSCSTDKKGYAGTVVFTKGAAPKKAASTKKQPAISSFFAKKVPKKEEAAAPSASADSLPVLGVTFGISADGDETFAGAAWQKQGRAITVEYESFFVVALYVLNSGQKLEQLEQRVNEWDPALRQYLQQLAAKKQVILTGDLNVAHADCDIWNPEAKHLAKQAGCTKQEKESFSKLLEEGPVKFVDSFRQQNPSAQGVFSYWSTRANGRATNHGIRLDYFVCSEGLFAKEGEEGAMASVRAHDSYVLDEATIGASDHAPVGLILALQ